MDLGRFLVDAVVLGGDSPTKLARSHPISESWLLSLRAHADASWSTGGVAATDRTRYLARFADGVAVPSEALEQVGRALEAGQSPHLELHLPSTFPE